MNAQPRCRLFTGVALAERAPKTSPSSIRTIASGASVQLFHVFHLLVAVQSPLLRRLSVRERPGKHCFRCWQEGPGYDRNINSVEALQASLNYIHMNPVRRGLCEKPTDWPWSSARYYMLEPPRQPFPDLPDIHGLPSGACDQQSDR